MQMINKYKKFNLFQKSYKRIAVGDSIRFGRYPQGAEGEELPIKWKVLNIENDVALLISEKCLIRSGFCDGKKAYGKPWYSTWELSQAREICNGDFYYQAFSSDERTYVIAKKTQSGDGTYLFDKAFLLSEDEVRLFLPEKEDRQAVPSDCLLSKQDGKEKVLLGFGDENKFTSWWLLPQKESETSCYPKAVWPNGEIQYHGRNIYHQDFTIRPCIMVKLTEEFRKGCHLMPGEAGLIWTGEAYSLEYIKSYHNFEMERKPGGRTAVYDSSLKKWRMRIRLDDKSRWFLSVFRHDNGIFDKFLLDDESSNDSHYEFSDENGIRKALCSHKDKNEYFAEILIRYVENHGGDELLKKIRPFITKEYHY